MTSFMEGRGAGDRLRRVLGRSVFVLALLYVLLSLALAVPFSNILFKPHAPRGAAPSLTMPGAEAVRARWAGEGLQVDALRVESAAGPAPIELSAWWIFHDSSRGKPTVAFLTGTGGLDPADFEDKVRLMAGRGFNCLLLDQRGYGASDGQLLSHGWHERGDFAAVVDALTSRYGIDPRRIGIWGISMGASNAVAIAAARPETRAILLYAPWSDPLSMAVRYVSRSYSVPKPLLYLPVWTAIRIGAWRNGGGALDPAEEARKVRCRALVVRGDRDEITPAELTDRLFQSLAGPKELVVVPGAHHNDLLDVMGTERYLEQMSAFFGPLLDS